MNTYEELKRIGENLSEVLIAIDMSQAELAERSGLTPAAISQILSGKRNASVASLVSILRVVPVKFERLLAREVKAERERIAKLKVDAK